MAAIDQAIAKLDAILATIEGASKTSPSAPKLNAGTWAHCSCMQLLALLLQYVLCCNLGVCSCQAAWERFSYWRALAGWRHKVLNQ